MNAACIRMNEKCHTLGGSRFMFDEAALSATNCTAHGGVLRDSITCDLFEVVTPERMVVPQNNYEGGK